VHGLFSLGEDFIYARDLQNIFALVKQTSSSSSSFLAL
jgi:hypothetical protein